MDDGAGPHVEGRTREWLQGCGRTAVDANAAPRHKVFDADGRAVGMSAYHFGRLLRKVKIFRWLDRLEFESLIDVASGYEHFPYLVRQRYGAETYYSDLVHEWNSPLDGLQYGKLDHAVTLRLPGLPFRDDAFDVVLCSEVFEHLVRPVEAVAELLRVARRYVVLTSLEALAPSRWHRRLLHHRVDVRVPHVERNFLLMDELRALFGAEGLHHENLFCDPALPASQFAPEHLQAAAYTALADAPALAAALGRAAAAGGHGAGTMGILLVKAKSGAPAPRTPRPEADEALAHWVVSEAAAEERWADTALAIWAAIERDPTLRPPEPAPDRPVAPGVLALLRCPDCRGELEPAPDGVRCRACGPTFRADYGVPILYPTHGDGAVPSRTESLDRLCGSDTGRRALVERLMDRLRRNEQPPGPVRRLAWRIERALGL